MEEVKVRQPVLGRCNCFTSPKYLNQTVSMDTCDKWGPEGGRGPKASLENIPPRKPIGKAI